MPLRNASTLRDHRGSGFTLIELIGVLVLVSILSVTAIPSLARLDTARDAAMIDESERLLRFAQSRAVSTGLPTGVMIDLDLQAMSLLTLRPDGTGVIPVNRELVGQPMVLHVESTFAGSRIDAAGPLDSVSSSGRATIWFDFDGTPQTRGADGADPQPLSTAFLLRSAMNREIQLTPITGRVQR